jgi:hypothetical protein
MKRDTLFEHKEVVVTCEENVGDANEYQKLLEPPIIFIRTQLAQCLGKR